MTTRLCTAPSHDRPPVALGELAVCEHHFGDITDALTGPPAATDLTMDAVWGVRTWWGVAAYDNRDDAERALVTNRVRYDEERRRKHGVRRWRQAPVLLVGDGEDWFAPAHYRPARIARDHAALGLRLTGQTTGEHIATRHSAEAPLPLDVAVAELRVDIHRKLALWTALHVEKFDLNTTPGPGATVNALAAFLAVHREQAAARDWGGAYADELHDLRRRARHLIDLPQPRRVAIAQCVETVGGIRCAGTLRLTPREERDVRPVSVACDTCPAVYTGERWHRLSARLIAQAGRMAA